MTATGRAWAAALALLCAALLAGSTAPASLALAPSPRWFELGLHAGRQASPSERHEARRLARLAGGRARATQSAPRPRTIDGAWGPIPMLAVSAAAPGAIAGTVTSALTTAPLGGIEVCAYSTGELVSEESFTEECRASAEGTGRYELTSLPPGIYVVEFSPPPELNYLPQYYNGKASEEEAEAVIVSSGETTPNIDAALLGGGTISGSVTAAVSKAPVANVRVCAFPMTAAGRLRCALTSSGGAYAVNGLATGSYKVQFSAPSESAVNLATQFYKGKAKRSEAEPVPATVGTVTGAIDAALTEGAKITGTVTALLNGAGLGGVEVCALPTGEEFFPRCTSTSEDGKYELGSLSSERYELVFSPQNGEYFPQFYKEAPTPLEAQELAMTVGESKTIDAALVKALEALTSPSISGAAVEGQTLHAVHASWSEAPTSYLDQWGRCDSAGHKCKQVGEGESYALSATDVGHTLQLREAASKFGAEGGFAYSSLTSVVAALSSSSSSGQSSSSSGPPPPTPAPALAGGVLNITIALPSAAQLRTLLASLLSPAGKNAKIAAILGHGGLTLSFQALSTGTLAIAWYMVPKGARLSAARPVLLAKGSVSLAGRGPARIAIKLTGKGKLMLRHSGRHLRLSAKGTLTSPGQATAKLIGSFTLKR